MADLRAYSDATYELQRKEQMFAQENSVSLSADYVRFRQNTFEQDRKRVAELDDVANKSLQKHFDAKKKLDKIQCSIYIEEEAVKEAAYQARARSAAPPAAPPAAQATDSHSCTTKMAGRKASRMRAQPYVLPDMHEIDCILNHKVVKFPNSVRLLFQVRWVGFPDPKDFTWEPRSRAKGPEAKRMFQTYMEQHDLFFLGL